MFTYQTTASTNAFFDWHDGWLEYGFTIPEDKPDPTVGWKAAQERTRVETQRIREMHTRQQSTRKHRPKHKRWKPKTTP